MSVQYAVVNYGCRANDDNEVEIMHVTDNFEYANKLAFHYIKKALPLKDYYYAKKIKILKNYYDEYVSIYLTNVIVQYRIGEVKYDDECEEYEKYDITDVWHNVWAVIKINNNDNITEKIEDIDEELIYEC